MNPLRMPGNSTTATTVTLKELNQVAGASRAAVTGIDKTLPIRFSKLALCSIILLVFSGLLTSKTVQAQDVEWIIATKEAPPFAMRGSDNQWEGLSITLWETLAERLDLSFRFEEASLSDMIDGVADGRFNASISAITITHEREQRVDFSHPFHTTG